MTIFDSNYMLFEIFVILFYCLLETNPWGDPVVVLILPMQRDRSPNLDEREVDILYMKNEFGFYIISSIFGLLS